MKSFSVFLIEQTRPNENSLGKPIHHTKEGIVNFWNWFGDSNVVDKMGRPLVLFHGSSADIEVFKSGSELKLKEKAPAIYFSTNPDYAANYAGKALDNNAPKLYAVYVKGKIFDPANKEHLNLLFNDKNIKKSMSPASLDGRMKAHEYNTYIPKGNFGVLEKKQLQNVLKKLGFDGYKTNEVGKDNYAVFSSAHIKSALGNNGNFSSESDSIIENFKENHD